ncbi:uncharacterized protein FFB20_03608 [Fusarium fujikuroi]|nr:uncharacterized protein FFB20_03608 [Fusarium fujikuroi]SCO27552.1 uncharacterized protein FFMR_00432 [Fusarium fujikuroi]SCO47843.1 uncharacterized protein FFNC_11864 [Fusarium fujikuroi]SCV51165.1 uncharacterized protein FFB14_11863 [Fusarium fujikuroi]
MDCATEYSNQEHVLNSTPLKNVPFEPTISSLVSAPISPELGTSHHERLSGAAGSRAQVQVAVGSGEMESP